MLWYYRGNMYLYSTPLILNIDCKIYLENGTIYDLHAFGFLGETHDEWKSVCIYILYSKINL